MFSCLKKLQTRTSGLSGLTVPPRADESRQQRQQQTGTTDRLQPSQQRQSFSLCRKSQLFPSPKVGHRAGTFVHKWSVFMMKLLCLIYIYADGIVRISFNTTFFVTFLTAVFISWLWTNQNAWICLMGHVTFNRIDLHRKSLFLIFAEQQILATSKMMASYTTVVFHHTACLPAKLISNNRLRF